MTPGRDTGGKPVVALLLDEPRVVCRIGAEIVIAHDLCPYRGMTLSQGLSSGRSIACV